MYGMKNGPLQSRTVLSAVLIPSVPYCRTLKCPKMERHGTAQLLLLRRVSFTPHAVRMDMPLNLLYLRYTTVVILDTPPLVKAQGTNLQRFPPDAFRNFLKRIV